MASSKRQNLMSAFADFQLTVRDSFCRMFQRVSQKHAWRHRPAVTTIFLAIMFLVLAALQCPNLKNRPKPAPGAWLVLLCKAADVPQEPHPPAFYTELFSKQQPDLLFAYFDAVSNHKVDVSASEVMGWFTMDVKSADIGPTVRNNNTAVGRGQTAKDCTTAMLASLAKGGEWLDPNDYVGVITVINTDVDVGAAGKSVVLTEHPEKEVGFIAHEMIHAMGFQDHSWNTTPDVSSDHVWNHGGDTEYGDCWDMMSYRTCVFTFTTNRGSLGQGPELQAAYRERLNWLPVGRVWNSSQQSSSTNTITLAPLSDPNKPGFLMARIETSYGNYVVEYRENARFDRGAPPSAVLVRESRYGNKTYVVERQSGGSAWRKGDMFTDIGSFISVTVDDIVLGAATVTINTAYAGPPAQLGDKCGDKYVGVVRQCVGALRCGARSNPPLVTIDYYCQP
ncbi:MAG: hypothetical protein ACJ79K_09725 [Gemmatimonadaceae bacterium]